MFGKTKQSGSTTHKKAGTTNCSRSNVEAAKSAKTSKSATRKTTRNCSSSRAEAAKTHATTTRNCGSISSSGSRSNKKTANCSN